jgi:WhiB family transcriptional regulator, redox-sensing transcriptional regulator
MRPGRSARLRERMRAAVDGQAGPELGPKALRLVLRELLFDGEDLPEWQRAAACARPEVDREVFFPPQGWAGDIAVAAAKRVCASCPVRATCLGDALAWEDPNRRHGVIGGLTVDERSRLGGAMRGGGVAGGESA